MKSIRALVSDLFKRKPDLSRGGISPDDLKSTPVAFDPERRRDLKKHFKPIDAKAIAAIGLELTTYDASGCQEWRLNGKLHRDDGPAVEWGIGGREWWRNGKLHREDGPAMELGNGTKEWWRNGKLHRDDGPAIVHPDGSEEWFRDGDPWPEGPLSLSRRAAGELGAALSHGAARKITAARPVRFRPPHPSRP